MIQLRMNPARSCLFHPGFPGGFFIIDASIVPECCNANDISNHQNDQDNNVDHRDLPPAPLDAGQHACFTRVAVVTEQRLIGVPFRAVGIDKHHPFKTSPDSLVLIDKVTICRRLTATRLNKQNLKGLDSRKNRFITLASCKKQALGAKVNIKSQGFYKQQNQFTRKMLNY